MAPSGSFFIELELGKHLPWSLSGSNSMKKEPEGAVSFQCIGDGLRKPLGASNRLKQDHKELRNWELVPVASLRGRGARRRRAPVARNLQAAGSSSIVTAALWRAFTAALRPGGGRFSDRFCRAAAAALRPCCGGFADRFPRTTAAALRRRTRGVTDDLLCWTATAANSHRGELFFNLFLRNHG